jgi:hypothetical protein
MFLKNRYDNLIGRNCYLSKAVVREVTSTGQNEPQYDKDEFFMFRGLHRFEL